MRNSDFRLTWKKDNRKDKNAYTDISLNSQNKARAFKFEYLYIESGEISLSIGNRRWICLSYDKNVKYFFYIANFRH